MALDENLLYVQVEQLKATQEMTGTAYAEADVPLVLEAASRAVDAHCQRRFWLDAEPQTRLYTAWNREWMRDWRSGYQSEVLVEIDDLVTLDELSVASQPGAAYDTTLTNGFLLEPANAPADGMPYTRIGSPHGGQTPVLPLWPHGVQVTGVFGWPQVPAAVRLATSILASRFLRRARDAPFGIIGFGGEEGGVRLSSTDPDVASLLQPLRR